MTVRELKEVPASFGDSINALTSLPNVMRTGGLFGDMVVRGAHFSSNTYLIDNIPIMDPMHFGGIHSIINNDLMSEIDLYASSFPARFGQAQGAVVSINTLDEVNKFGGVFDLGLISASSIFYDPIQKEVPADDECGVEKVNNGYFIVSGRLGYIPMTIRPIYELVTDEDAGWLPYYGDYQIKAKYFFSRSNSLTFLAFGAYDAIDAVMPEDGIDKRDDPLMVGAQFKVDTMLHAQGLTHTYKPGAKLTLTNLLFSSQMFSYRKLAVEKSPLVQISEGVVTESKPVISGYKGGVHYIPSEDFLEFRGGLELQHYYFRTDGESLVLKEDADDFITEGGLEAVRLGDRYHNYTAGGFFETKFEFSFPGGSGSTAGKKTASSGYGKLTVVPGVRLEYLRLTGDTVVDPRGMISYEFPTDTTVSAAGGKYSMFLQTNPKYFKDNPEIADLDYLDAQTAWHRSAAVEQKIDLWTFKIEGFYNTFADLVNSEYWTTEDGEERFLKNGTELKTYGLEFMVRLDGEENLPGAYGWMSYTYGRSRWKADAPNLYPDLDGRWVDSSWDMIHVVKLIAGYRYKRHTLGSRLQFNSSAPYTPIEGSGMNAGLNPNAPDGNRYYPVYGEWNSARYDYDYRLDLRYSNKREYCWGSLTWYVEVINATNRRPLYYDWDYRYPYDSGNNPELVERDAGIALIPNFGVEVKF
jgi:hypothetical protein